MENAAVIFQQFRRSQTHHQPKLGISLGRIPGDSLLILPDTFGIGTKIRLPGGSDGPVPKVYVGVLVTKRVTDGMRSILDPVKVLVHEINFL